MHTIQETGGGAVDLGGGAAVGDRASAVGRRAELSLERLAAILGGHANGRTIFGEAVHGEGVTAIPVARAAWGFGGGSGEALPAAGAVGDARRAAQPGWGVGGGGGVTVTPVGYIVLRRGDAEFRPITALGRLLAAAAAGALLGAWIARRPGRREGRS
jgi:uncharacterized spore protein YtfJ